MRNNRLIKQSALALGFIGVTALFAQEKMYIHKSTKETLGAPLAKADSIYFSADGANMLLALNDSTAQFPVSAVDSVSFGEDSDIIYITYIGNQVSIVNPLAFEGVQVQATGADVVINSTLEKDLINYHISGTTEDGSLKIYSVKKFNLKLNGVAITNPDGPAINIQSGKNAYIELLAGTNSVLNDGTTYAAAPLNAEGEEEDQDAALFSEGDLKFSGSGNLTVNAIGTKKHAIASDDEIEILSGNITIAKSQKDGIHGKSGVEISGGQISVISNSDAIDGDEGYVNISGGNIEINNTVSKAHGIVCDSTLNISGGEINITLAGDQAKALKAAQDINLSSGIINITTTGAAVLEAEGSGYNPSYSTGIKSDANVNASGANITIITKGVGGKGISADKDINIRSGIVTITSSGNGATYQDATNTKDVYNSTCLTADRNINIIGGTCTFSNSGTAGKGISADTTITIGDPNIDTFPIINITTTGTKILISGSGQNASYAEAKAVKADKDFNLIIGNVTISSADDGIKAEGTINIEGGNLTISKSIEGLEAPYINIKDGNTSVASSDDAINGTKGNGGEGSDGSLVHISGGTVVLDASAGDGLDSNGDITIDGGVVLVHGPKSQPEVGADINGTFKINGGLVVVAGPNSMMTESAASSSTQNSMLAKWSQSLAANSLFHIEDASGKSLLTFQCRRAYTSLLFSSPEFVNGSYKIMTGGTCTGTNSNGLFTGGEYTGGTLKKSFTISQKVSTVSF